MDQEVKPKYYVIVYRTALRTTEVVRYQNAALAHAFLQLIAAKGLWGCMFPDMDA